MKDIIRIQACFFVYLLSWNFSSAVGFTQNRGQILDQHYREQKDIDYSLSTPDIVMFFKAGSVHYEWTLSLASSRMSDPGISTGSTNDSSKIYRLDMQLVGANVAAEAIEIDTQISIDKYYTAQHPEGLEARSFGQIVYKDIYPNIDWLLYIKDGKLEYDFIIHQGGNPADIKIQYNGSTAIEKIEGSVEVSTPFGSITESTPYAYDAETKQRIPCSFVLKNNQLSFDIKSDGRPIVIDPVVNWATYFGGTGYEQAEQTATDAAGNVYIAGRTGSANNIATTGAYQTTISSVPDGFIAKYNAAGTRLWSTYFGGTGDDELGPIACTKNGTIFVGGTTNSSTLATPGAYKTNLSVGFYDAMLARFDSAGNRVWCTYFGGTGTDDLLDLTLDTAENIVFCGMTGSGTGLSTSGSFQPLNAGLNDGFIAKFTPAGFPVWATYFGGVNHDNAQAVHCDRFNNIYVSGIANSGGLATTNSFQPAMSGTSDPYLVKFDANGARQWSTYYGGVSDSDHIGSITSDIAGNIYIGGGAGATSNIATSGAHQSSGAGFADGFLAKFNSTGMRQWSTYLGGPGFDDVSSIDVGMDGLLYLHGSSTSLTGISTANAFQKLPGGVYDIFITEFTTAGRQLWGSYFGGPGYEDSYGTLITPGKSISKNKINIGFYTTSNVGIATPTADQTIFGGLGDAFILQLETDTAVFIDIPYIDTVLCAGNNLLLNYDVTHSYNSSNVFKVELSDNVGSFTAPVQIGSIISSVAGTINCTIPNTAVGNNYKIRIVSTSPADTSYENELNIRIEQPSIPAATVSVIPDTNITTGTLTTFTAVATNAGQAPQYQWKVNGVDVVGANSAAWSTTNIKDGDKICCVVTSSNVCAMPKQTACNEIGMHVFSGVAEIKPNSKYSIYPNPNNGEFVVTGYVEPKHEMRFTLISSFGQVVFNEKVIPSDEWLKYSIDSEGLSSGVYMLLIEQGDKMEKLPVVIQ